MRTGTQTRQQNFTKILQYPESMIPLLKLHPHQVSFFKPPTGYFPLMDRMIRTVVYQSNRAQGASPPRTEEPIRVSMYNGLTE